MAEQACLFPTGGSIIEGGHAGGGRVRLRGMKEGKDIMGAQGFVPLRFYMAGLLLENTDRQYRRVLLGQVATCPYRGKESRSIARTLRDVFFVLQF